MTPVPDCKTVTSRLDELREGALPPAEAAALEQHIAACGRCAAARDDTDALRTALQAMHVPEMRPGFAREALAAAVAQDPGATRTTRAGVPAVRETRHGMRRGFGFARRGGLRPRLGMAAGVAATGILAVAAWWGMSPGTVLPEQAASRPGEVTVALYEPRDVSIAIDAAQDMPGARLTISVAGGIELVGFGDTRQLSWETDLEKGTNMLSLPVLAHSLEQGRLTARIEHGDREQQIELAIRADAPRGEGR